MKKIGIVYIIVGVIAVVGAVIAAYVVFSLSEALGIINSASASELPPGTDIAQLQSYASTLNMLILAGWVWVISVMLSGLISVYFGVLNLRSKK